MTTYGYVGSFAMPDGPAGDALHVFRIDRDTGAMHPVASGSPRLNVGSTCIDPGRGVLYATDEVRSTAEFREREGVAGGGGGRVYAYAIDRGTGRLTEIDHRPSYGTQPAGITVDATGRFLTVTHFTGTSPITRIAGDHGSGYRIELAYDDATTVLFPLDDAGGIGAPCDVHRHGASEPSSTPGPSCLHSVTTSPDGSFAVVCDLAKGRIITLVIDRATRTLREQQVHETAPGRDPRYCAFHPTLPVFYVNDERRPVIETFAYREGGAVEALGTLDVLPDGAEAGADDLQSDIRVHPSGRWLYTLVRGLDVVTVAAIDGSTGALRRIQTAPLDGVGPKGCAVSPDGRFLYITASRSDRVLIWRIGDDGTVAPTGRSAEVPRPNTIVLFESPTA